MISFSWVFCKYTMRERPSSDSSDLNHAFLRFFIKIRYRKVLFIHRFSLALKRPHLI